METTSPDGRYRLRAEGKGYDFTYRFWDGAQLLWKREQPDREGSPLSAYVSDLGNCVLNLQHIGLDPQILTLDSEGFELLRVPVSHPERATGYFWPTRSALWGTAGTFWSGGAWPYFFPFQGVSLSTRWDPLVSTKRTPVMFTSRDPVMSSNRIHL